MADIFAKSREESVEQSSLRDFEKIQDIHPVIWIGFPVGSILLCILASIIGGTDFYFRTICPSEAGYLEHSTFIMLLIAIVLFVWLLFRRHNFPQRWLAIWILLLALGSVYFAGEEISWGQHFFQIPTPRWWSKINYRGETNLHNTFGVFDEFPRALLTGAAMIGMLLPVFVARCRRHWDPDLEGRVWLVPTPVVIPACLLALMARLPQKLYSTFGSEDMAIPQWIDCVFIKGRSGELKEHFLAMFILLYAGSFAYRYRNFLKKTMGNSEN